MDTPPREDDAPSRDGGIVARARAHPLAVATLAASIGVGAWVGYAMLSHDWSAPRRLAGGAIAGGGCWVLVMAGRMM